MSCHQNQSAVAIVDTLGRATILRGDLFNYKAVAREVLHWHHFPPFAVKFSTQGKVKTPSPYISIELFQLTLLSSDYDLKEACKFIIGYIFFLLSIKQNIMKR